MLLSTLCFGQGNKIQCVPDSMRCLSPSQVDKILEMGDELVTYKNAYENMRVIAQDEQKKAAAFKNAYINSQKENEVSIQQEKNCQTDKKVIEKQLASESKKNALQKVGLWVLGGLSAIETGYIGITLLLRGIAQ